MKPKKIDFIHLIKIIRNLRRGSKQSVGKYLYKGFHIQISHYMQTGNQRVREFYRNRREKGLCIRCGEKVVRRNPKTSKLYRLCDKHLKEIDRKPPFEFRKKRN
jgi:hypothetical protein